jgi:uncharacterized membrane protein YeaQ/YmgE (transglycosylase-associated protein family)
VDFIGDIAAAPFICLGWVIVGAIAGALARSIMKSNDMPFLADVILGIAGAFVGGILAGIAGLGPEEDAGGLGLVLVNLLIATFGAMVLIGARRAVT